MDLDRRGLLGLAGLAVLGAAGCSSTPADQPFPTIATDRLDARARRVVEVLRAEHAAQPGRARYTPVDEPWCADFVSWVERAAGTPLRNPHSGGWRIPGTMTLREHLRATGTWHDSGNGYSPAVGDIAIYDGAPFGQHTNYVVQVADGVVTTCGGNEDDRIRVSTYRLDDDVHLLGHGHRV